MYTVSVEARFSAVHRVSLPDGGIEPAHGHDWLVRVHFAADELDKLDMVVDFKEAASALRKVLSGLHRKDLNDHPSLAGRKPTAEVLARYIFDQVQGSGRATIRKVELIESPGCVAAFESDDSDTGKHEVQNRPPD